MRQILKNLRTTIGISQRQLAAFVGGDRTQLVRAENGERNLCDAANLQLIHMIPAYSMLQQISPPLEEMPATDLEDFARHAAYCRYKVTALQRQLKQLQTIQLTAHRLKVFVEQLSREMDNNLSPRQERWLQERAYEAEKRLEQSNHGRQRKLELQIAALQAEATIYENVTNDVLDQPFTLARVS